MPAQGPGSPSDKEVDIILEDVMNFLKEKYNIQKFPPLDFGHDYCIESREKTKYELRQALYKLVELQYWENF